MITIKIKNKENKEIVPKFKKGQHVRLGELPAIIVDYLCFSNEYCIFSILTNSYRTAKEENLQMEKNYENDL